MGMEQQMLQTQAFKRILKYRQPKCNELQNLGAR